jgi:hypothetical protein
MLAGVFHIFEGDRSFSRKILRERQVSQTEIYAGISSVATAATIRWSTINGVPFPVFLIAETQTLFDGAEQYGCP